MLSESPRVVFYNTLRSLDVMQEISNCNFLDHLLVSQELVKFLSLHTSVEAVDTLNTNMGKVESKLSSLESDVKGAGKTATTVGKKCDDLQNEVKELGERIKNWKSESKLS